MRHATASAAPRPDKASSVDAREVARFEALAETWWDPDGPMRPLHRLQPVRLGYIRRRLLARFGGEERALRPFRALRLLDLGCGGGLLSEPLARMGAQVTAVDAAEGNVRAARAHADAAGLAIDYRRATAEELVAAGERFDAVVCMEVVEHVADAGAFLADAVALVRPGGLLLLSTLNRTPRAYLLAVVGAERVLRWLPPGTHEWRRFVRPAELLGHLETAGARLVDVTGVSFVPVGATWRESRDRGVNYMACAEVD